MSTLRHRLLLKAVAIAQVYPGTITQHLLPLPPLGFPFSAGKQKVFMHGFITTISWLQRTLHLLLRAAISWSEHRAATMGAAIAFYTLFSMGPVVVIAIAIAGSFYGHDAAQAGLLSQVQALLGQQAARAVSAVIQTANQPDRAVWQTTLAIVTSLFAATTVFTELKGSLDIIWDTPSPPRMSVWHLVRSRLLSFGIVLSVGFILLVSLLLSTLLAALESRYGHFLGISIWLLSMISNAVSTLVVSLLFAAIFKFLPERQVAWRDVWRGALLTACLYMVGKGLLAFYLGTAGVVSSYGAAGTLVLILLWMFYSAQVFLFGAELSREMARERDCREHLACKVAGGVA